MTRLTRCAGWAAIAVVAIAAIVVAGCGDGGGDGLGPTTGSISGTIIHAGTGLPLGGIQVTAGGVTTTTNSSGQFTLSGVPQGSQTVTITIDPDRDLALPPGSGSIVVNVQPGQNTPLPSPVLVIDGPDMPPDPPV